MGRFFYVRLSLVLSGLLLIACSRGAIRTDPIPNPPPTPDTSQEARTTPEPIGQQIPILLYHHLSPEPEPEPGNAAVLTVAEFREQMASLRSAGWQAITTAELEGWLTDQAVLPAKAVLITFDDGYRSNWQYAYPILQEHGLKATLFLVTSKVGRTPGHYPYVNWSDLQEMHASEVFEIQAHSHDGHLEIDGKPALLTWNEAQIQADLAMLQAELTHNELPASTAYAYPFGAFDEKSITALRERGIRLGLGGEQGLVTQGDDPFRLKRLSIWPGISACRLLVMMGDPPSTCTP